MSRSSLQKNYERGVLTIPNAARLLGLTEHILKGYINSGELLVILIPTRIGNAKRANAVERRIALRVLERFAQEKGLTLLTPSQLSSQ